MSIFINKIIVAGNLTADPEVQQTTTGVPVVRFFIAVRRKYVKDGETPVTDFHRCTLWHGQAEFFGKYARKGDLVYVEGELQNRSWTDKQGQKRYATEIIGDDVKIQSLRREGASADAGNVSETYVPPTYTAPPVPPFGEEYKDDDLPF